MACLCSPPRRRRRRRRPSPLLRTGPLLPASRSSPRRSPRTPGSPGATERRGTRSESRTREELLLLLLLLLRPSRNRSSRRRRSLALPRPRPRRKRREKEKNEFFYLLQKHFELHTLKRDKTWHIFFSGFSYTSGFFYPFAFLVLRTVPIFFSREIFPTSTTTARQQQQLHPPTIFVAAKLPLPSVKHAPRSQSLKQ